MKLLPERKFEFDVDGQLVTCFQCPRGRIWWCECERFARTFDRGGEGYCPHVVVAIQMAIEDGILTLDDYPVSGALRH